MKFSEFKKMVNEIDESIYGNRKVILETSSMFNTSEASEINVWQYYDKGLCRVLDILDQGFNNFDPEDIIHCIVIK